VETPRDRRVGDNGDIFFKNIKNMMIAVYSACVCCYLRRRTCPSVCLSVCLSICVCLCV